MSFRNEQRDLDDTLKSIIGRLDDLERQRGCDCVCNCCEGTIWLSTTLRQGDTTWTSLDGDTRTLDPISSATTANGGIVWSDQFNNDLNIHRLVGYPPGEEFTFPVPGLFVFDYTVSTWITPSSGGADGPHYSYVDFRDFGGDARLNRPRGGSLDRGYALEGPNEAGDWYIEAIMATAGLSGYGQVRFRGEVYVSLDTSVMPGDLYVGGPTGPLTYFGTKNFPAGGLPTAIWDQFQLRNGSQFGGPAFYNPPNFYARPVLHRLYLEYDGEVLANLSQAEIDLQRTDLPGGGILPRTYTLNGTRELNGDFVFCPGGAPLMIRHHFTGTRDPDDVYTPKIFTDGPALTDPAIYYALSRNPSGVQIANEDPLTWEPPESAVIYAVADLAGFTDITDGWPTDYWPIGSIIG